MHGEELVIDRFDLAQAKSIVGYPYADLEVGGGDGRRVGALKRAGGKDPALLNG